MRRAAMLSLLLTFGCGEKNRDVIQRLGPGYDDLRGKIHRLADELPPPGKVTVTELPRLQPPPVSAATGSNLEVAMVEEALNPEVAALGSEVAAQIGLDLARDLIACVRLLSKGGGVDGNELQADGKPLSQRCEPPLGYRYLLLIRPVEYTQPEVEGSEFFARLGIEGFLFDLPAGKLLGSFRTDVEPPDQLKIRYGTKWERDGVARSAVFAALRERARAAVVAAVAQAGGRLEPP